MMKTNKVIAGKIIRNGVKIEAHENKDISTLAKAMRANIELIKPANTKGRKSADFTMCGIDWELKSPEGKSRRNLEHIMKRAAKQSSNIVISLRRTKLDDAEAIKQLRGLFGDLASLKRLLVVKKTGEIKRILKPKKKSCKK